MHRNTTRFSLLLALAAALLMASLGTATAQSDTAVSGPTLNMALIARAVADHEPIGTEGPFVADGERLYVFLEVDNPGPDPVEYTVNWHNLDRDRHFSQTIEAGRSPRWRTWVYRNASARYVGNWHVEVVAPSGDVQAQLDFTVVSAEAAGGELTEAAASND